MNTRILDYTPLHLSRSLQKHIKVTVREKDLKARSSMNEPWVSFLAFDTITFKLAFKIWFSVWSVLSDFIQGLK